MSRKFSIITPDDFSYLHTVRSHGWYDLAPYKLSDDARLSAVLFRGVFDTAVEVEIAGKPGKIEIKVLADSFDRKGVERDIRHILRLDENYGEFYRCIEDQKQVVWAQEARAGRLLRGPNVWEDLVKTMCTTNCSWALTRIMVNNLVNELGEPARTGVKGFPTAQAMADRDETFYRERIKAGYRAPFFVELAQRTVAGEIEPETWLTSNLTTEDLRKEMKKIKGVGDYAADNLLKLVGRYDGLALDSFLRGKFYEKHNKGKKCKDIKIERYYKRFKDWRGLAIWCDMTEDWFKGI